jgi:hypothetical protein
MHSAVRQLAGIAFEGGSYGESFVLADVRLQGALPHDEVILYFSPAGMVVVAPLPDGVHRIVATVDAAPETPDVAFVQSLLDSRGPERAPVRVTQLLWGSRFRGHHRIARSYRSGRVLIAGDAAHVHSPAGGQGMNLGIVDAVTLAAALVSALQGNEAALEPHRRPGGGAGRPPDAAGHRGARLARRAQPAAVGAGRRAAAAAAPGVAAVGPGVPLTDAAARGGSIARCATGASASERHTDANPAGGRRHGAGRRAVARTGAVRACG